MLIAEVVETPEKLLNDEVVGRRAVGMFSSFFSASSKHAAESRRHGRIAPVPFVMMCWAGRSGPSEGVES